MGSGGFQPIQSATGGIACLEIFNRVFTGDDLLKFSDCEHKGDVYSLSSDAIETFGQTVTCWTDAPENLPIGSRHLTISESVYM